jgi:hypothetical protein
MNGFCRTDQKDYLFFTQKIESERNCIQLFNPDEFAFSYLITGD